MESLKKLAQICQKDIRQDAIEVMDPTNSGVFRKLTLEDFHRAAESIQLHAGVPEEIRSHFETARNLIVYSWFYYPFNVTAQLTAYTTVEYALRLRSGDRKTSFKHLLKKAVNARWISDAGFSIARRKAEYTREQNERLLSIIRTQEPSLVQKYSDALVREYSDGLAESIPFLRNELAHGTSMLHEQGEIEVRICSEIINQLFHLTKAS
jgi:hypothetical protein